METDSQRQDIQVGDIHLSMTLTGPRQHHTQTLVALHGFTGSAANWHDTFSRLASPDRLLIACDLPGHGRSDAPDEAARYSIEHSRTDLIAALIALGIQKGEAILLGYSLGGRIALYTALSGFFRALILESASPGLADPVAREQRRRDDDALADRIEREGVPAFVDHWENIPLFASQRRLAPEIQARLRAQRLTNRATGLANSLRGVGTGAQPALHDQLSALSLPVLLLAGELDQKFAQIAQAMAQDIPQASLHIVPDSGHTIHLEQPDTFAQLIDAFCQSVYAHKKPSASTEAGLTEASNP